jgi:hypothetical protein
MIFRTAVYEARTYSGVRGAPHRLQAVRPPTRLASVSSAVIMIFNLYKKRFRLVKNKSDRCSLNSDFGTVILVDEIDVFNIVFSLGITNVILLNSVWFAESREQEGFTYRVWSSVRKEAGKCQAISFTRIGVQPPLL